MAFFWHIVLAEGFWGFLGYYNEGVICMSFYVEHTTFIQNFPLFALGVLITSNYKSDVPFFCRLIVGLFLLIYFKKFFLWRKNNKKFRVGETRIRKIRHGRVTLNHDYSAALLGLYLNTMPYGMDKVSQDQGEIDLFWCKMVCCTQVPLHAAWLRLFRPIVG